MIEESNTINQLNLALNELLDAYDALKGENDTLIAENAQLKKEVEDLSGRNEKLEKDVSSLNSTTKHHTSEIDSMLGRIKSTLNSNAIAAKKTPEVKETPNSATTQAPVEQKEEKTVSPENNNTVQPTPPAKEDTPAKEEPKDSKNNSKEIDLGRMQSLLSGFNN